MSWCFDEEIRDEVNEQAMLAFFKDLHIDFDVAIERRENLSATIDRETISAQNIDFLDVAIDENSEEISKEDVTSDMTTNFDDVRDDERDEIDIEDEADAIDSEICNEDEAIDCWADFDFFACRVRICSWNLMLLSNFVLFLQRLHVYFSARFFAIRISFCCFNNFFAFCFILLFILNSCFRKW